MKDSSIFIPEPLTMQEGLKARLPDFAVVQWVGSTGSTNADLYALARQPDASPMRPWLLGAHLQTHGRGRAGRGWQNRRGANLMFSCAFDIFLPAAQLPVLAPLAGLSAAETLGRLLSPEKAAGIGVKWPNDILWRGAKLSGILVEATRAGTARQTGDHHVAIIGLGLNLEDARSMSQSLNRRIADWREVCAADAQADSVTAIALVGSIVQGWRHTLGQAVRHGLQDLPERWALRDALAGRTVDIHDQGKLLQTGVACGINQQGQLLLGTANGEQTISVGDVSVRLNPGEPG
ncbi:MAG: biotin--[acetyl-CoA-carboxylase] ligase [Castellaniella sp.]